MTDLIRTWTQDDTIYGRDEEGVIYKALPNEEPARIYPTWVHTANGHHFLHEDGTYVRCIACGGMWEERQPNDDDPHFGSYEAANGDPATLCKGPEAEHGEDVPPGTTNPCNCLFCNN